MEATADDPITQACARLFALHADGFKRKRPARRPPVAMAPSVATRVSPVAPLVRSRSMI